MAKKNLGGRRLGTKNGNGASKLVQTKLSSDAKDKLEQKAQSHGQTLSAYVRMIILKDLGLLANT